MIAFHMMDFISNFFAYDNGNVKNNGPEKYCNSPSYRKTQTFTFEKYMYTPYELEFIPDTLVEFAKNNYNAMYIIVCLYISIVIIGQRIMKTRERAICSSNSNFFFAWNIFLALFSIYGTSRVVPYVFLNAVHSMRNNVDIYNIFVSVSCDNAYAVKNGPASLWVCLFVFSKALELGDTIFLILRKRKISMLHFWHHSTVLPWAWNELAHESAPSATFAAMNLAVHSLMYAYFAIVYTEYGRKRFPSHGKIPKLITFVQCLQMFCGIVLLSFAYYHKNFNNFSATSFNNCNVTNTSIGISLFIYVTYLILFLHFANDKYGIYTRLKLYFLLYNNNNKSTEGNDSNNSSCNDNENNKQKWPWRNEKLTLEEQYSLATQLVTMLSYLFTEEEGMKVYGAYKQVEKLSKRKKVNEKESITSGFIEIPETKSFDHMCEKDLKKYKARQLVSNLGLNESMKLYIDVMNKVADRSNDNLVKSKKLKNSSTTYANNVKHTIVNEDNIIINDDPGKIKTSCSILYNATIIGYGKAMPKRIVTNDEVEKVGNFPIGSIQNTRCGVITRHHANLLNGENQIQLACAAIQNAVKKAGLDLYNDVDCIIHCGGVPHQAIPDDACLIQNELGLGDSGVPSFTIHATCLSFVVAMDIAGSFIQHGRHRTIILSACNAGRTHNVNKTDPHTAPLFGDGAAAIILSSKTFASNVLHNNESLSGAINHYSFETFGVGSDLCAVKGGGTFDPYLNNAQFIMDGPGTIGLVGRYLRPCTARFVDGLDHGLSSLRLHRDTNENQTFDVNWVVPHQASALALDALSILGWEKEKILTTISKYGNCIGVSIPLTLIDGIENGRIVRGDKICLVGTSAGISFGGMIITY